MTHPKAHRLERTLVTWLRGWISGAGEPPCWAVGFSGGADSLALLHGLLHALGHGLPETPVVAVHVNHRARPGATVAATQAQRLAVDLGATFIGLGPRQPPRRTNEESLRTLRYDGFSEALRRLPRGTPLLLAHTADDQAENVLVRLLRGTGLAGLAPMVAQTGPYLRPLLALTRADVLDYLDRQGLAEAVIDDPTNHSGANLRGRLRTTVLPLLERENPQVRAHLVEVARQAGALAAALDAHASILADSRLAATESGGFTLDLSELDEASAAALVRLALARLGVTAPPSAERTRAAVALTVGPARGGRVVQLGAGFVATRMGSGRIRIEPSALPDAASAKYRPQNA